MNQETCYLCNAVTDDWVMENVEIYRDQFGSQRGDQPVHANRRICRAFQRENQAARMREGARQDVERARRSLEEAEARLAEAMREFPGGGETNSGSSAS